MIQILQGSLNWGMTVFVNVTDRVSSCCTFREKEGSARRQPTAQSGLGQLRDGILASVGAQKLRDLAEGVPVPSVCRGQQDAHLSRLIPAVSAQKTIAT